MSKRPVSVEELINKNNSGSEILTKPKFLSKEERQKLALLRRQKEVSTKNNKPSSNGSYKRIYQGVEEEGSKTVTQKPKKRFKKFNFDWDEDEDTSSEYRPLVTRDNNASDLGLTGTHWSERSLDEMTARDWRVFKDDYNIIAKGSNIDNPLRAWKEAKIPNKLLDCIMDMYQEPTPIQRATIPLALNQRDVVGVAETGSGKTLAFLIPLFSYVLSIDANYILYEHQQDFNKPLGLILAPTRELALQITKEATKFGEKLGLNTVSIIGGHQYEETVHSVRNGVHIIVATPGRLIDSIERGIIGLDKCYFCTMDEADKMIDMGFEKSLQTILSYLPCSEYLNNSIDSKIFNIKKRITLMFTATISPPIEKITKSYLINPGYLFIGNAGEAIDNIDQRFEYVAESKEELDPIRFERLVSLIRSHVKESNLYSIIVFANYKKVCEVLSIELAEKGYNNTVIHGSKSQEARERAISDFRSHKARILIATDVAARGIDVPNVSLVINFQMSKKFDEYIHRIGRTGRAGKKGISFTFLDDSDSGTFLDLKKFLVKGDKKCPDWLLKHSSTQSQLLRD